MSNLCSLYVIDEVKGDVIMLTVLLCVSFFSPGTAEAIEAYVSGELCLITFGKPSAEVTRDPATGLLCRSLGCVIREGDLEYMEDWNRFMMDAWRMVAADELFFSLEVETESLEYKNGICIYRDSWGSVPVEVYPEEIAHVVFLGSRTVRVEAECYGRLELFQTQYSDTLRARVPLDSDVILDMFRRGREAIRVNTLN